MPVVAYLQKMNGKIPPLDEYVLMSAEPDNTIAMVSVEKIQRDWMNLTLRMAQAETERAALEADNKALRALLERVIEHRQKSHGELVNLLT